jgi:hypothetical protein
MVARIKKAAAKSSREPQQDAPQQYRENSRPRIRTGRLASRLECGFHQVNSPESDAKCVVGSEPMQTSHLTGSAIVIDLPVPGSRLGSADSPDWQADAKRRSGALRHVAR